MKVDSNFKIEVRPDDELLLWLNTKTLVSKNSAIIVKF